MVFASQHNSNKILSTNIMRSTLLLLLIAIVACIAVAVSAKGINAGCAACEANGGSCIFYQSTGAYQSCIHGEKTKVSSSFSSKYESECMQQCDKTCAGSIYPYACHQECDPTCRRAKRVTTTTTAVPPPSHHKKGSSSTSCSQQCSALTPQCMVNCNTQCASSVSPYNCREECPEDCQQKESACDASCASGSGSVPFCLQSCQDTQAVCWQQCDDSCDGDEGCRKLCDPQCDQNQANCDTMCQNQGRSKVRVMKTQSPCMEHCNQMCAGSVYPYMCHQECDPGCKQHKQATEKTKQSRKVSDSCITSCESIESSCMAGCDNTCAGSIYPYMCHHECDPGCKQAEENCENACGNVAGIRKEMIRAKFAQMKQHGKKQ